MELQQASPRANLLVLARSSSSTASWIAHLVSSIRNLFLLSCRKSLLARNYRSERARSSIRSARKGPSLADSCREPQGNSPSNIRGHGNLSWHFCTKRYAGQPLPGSRACMLQGREQILFGVRTSELGEVSLWNRSQDLFCP